MINLAPQCCFKGPTAISTLHRLKFPDSFFLFPWAEFAKAGHPRLHHFLLVEESYSSIIKPPGGFPWHWELEWGFSNSRGLVKNASPSTLPILAVPLSLPVTFLGPLLPYLSAVLSACQGQTGLRRSVQIKTGRGDGGGRWRGWHGGPGQTTRVRVMTVISKQLLQTALRRFIQVIFRLPGALPSPKRDYLVVFEGAQLAPFIENGYDWLTWLWFM